MTDPSETNVWVTAAQRGDRLALAKLLARCHPQLRTWATARIAPDLKAKIDPDDVLQEVYIDVARQIDRFEDRGPGSFIAWARAILSQRLIDARRAAQCQARDIGREVSIKLGDADSCGSLLDQVYADSGTPSRIIRRQEALQALLASLPNLSESHRQVIKLRFLDGLSVADAAAQLGKSEDAIVALTKRALAALRAAIDRVGDFTRG
jgi:RNA polymerase sigma-70 factor (ECF subfamily)